MPLGNSVVPNSTGISLSPYTILNDCQKGKWKTLDKQFLGAKMEMIILRYEGIVGAVPPMTNYQAIANSVGNDEHGQPKIKREEYQKIFEYLLKQCSQKTALWFIPVFTNSDFKPGDMEKFSIPRKAIWYTNIKSVGMTSDKFGFYAHLDRVAGSGKALSEVITSCEFGVTHKWQGTKDVEGLRDWNAREPQTDEELELIQKGREILAMIDAGDSSSVDQIFRFPTQNLVQSVHVENYDLFRGSTVQTFLEPVFHQIAASLFDGSLIPPGQLNGMIQQHLLPGTADMEPAVTTVEDLEASVQTVDVDVNDGGDYDAADVPIETIVANGSASRRRAAGVR